jgi:hypothetical protein
VNIVCHFTDRFNVAVAIWPGMTNNPLATFYIPYFFYFVLEQRAFFNPL